MLEDGTKKIPEIKVDNESALDAIQKVKDALNELPDEKKIKITVDDGKGEDFSKPDAPEADVAPKLEHITQAGTEMGTTLENAGERAAEGMQEMGQQGEVVGERIAEGTNNASKSFEHLIRLLHEYLELTQKVNNGDHTLLDHYSGKWSNVNHNVYGADIRQNAPTKKSIKLRLDDYLDQRNQIESGVDRFGDPTRYTQKSLDYSLRQLTEYVYSLHDAEEAAKIFGKKNTDVFALVQDNIQRGITASQAFETREAKISGIIHDLRDLGMDSITFGQKDQLEESLQTGGIESFAQTVKKLFGIEIPESLRKTSDAFVEVRNSQSNENSISSPALDKKVAEIQYLYDKIRSIYDGPDGIINEDMSYAEKFNSSEVQQLITLLSQLSDAELEVLNIAHGEEWINEFRSKFSSYIEMIKEIQIEKQKAIDGTSDEDADELDLNIWRHLESIYDTAQTVTREFESSLTPAVQEFLSLVREGGNTDNPFGFQSIDRYINEIIQNGKSAKEVFADFENAFGWDTDRFYQLIEGEVPVELKAEYDALFNEVEKRLKTAEQAADEFNTKLREFHNNETPDLSPTPAIEEETAARKKLTNTINEQREAEERENAEQTDTSNKVAEFHALVAAWEQMNEASEATARQQRELDDYIDIESLQEEVAYNEKITNAIKERQQAQEKLNTEQTVAQGAGEEAAEIGNVADKANEAKGAKEGFASANEEVLKSIISSLKGLSEEGNAFENLAKLINSLGGNGGADKLGRVTSLLQELGKTLSTPVSDNALIHALKDLSGNDLSGLAEVLKANKEQIAKAKEALGKSDDGQAVSKMIGDSQVFTPESEGWDELVTILASAEREFANFGKDVHAEKNFQLLLDKGDELYTTLQKLHDTKVIDDKQFEDVNRFLNETFKKINTDSSQEIANAEITRLKAEEEAYQKQRAKYKAEGDRQAKEEAEKAQKEANAEIARLKAEEENYQKQRAKYKAEGEAQAKAEAERAQKEVNAEIQRLKAEEEAYQKQRAKYKAEGEKQAKEEYQKMQDSVDSGENAALKQRNALYDKYIKNIEAANALEMQNDKLRNGPETKQFENAEKIKNNEREILDLEERRHAIQQELIAAQAVDVQRSREVAEAYIEAARARENAQNIALGAAKDSAVAQIGGWSKKLDELVKSKKFTPDFTKELIAGIETFNQALNDIGKTTSLDEVKAKVKELEGLFNRLNLDKSFKDMKQAADSSLEKIGEKIRKIMRQNSGMGNEFKIQYEGLLKERDLAQSIGDLDRLAAKVSKLNQELDEAGKTGRSFFDTLHERIVGVNAQFLAQYFSWQDWIRYIREAATTVKELNTALVEMQKVSDVPLSALKDYQKSTFDMANEIGTTALALDTSSADWMRLGYSLEDAAQAAKESTVLLNVSEFENINDATEALVSTSQAYKELNQRDIIDVVNKIGNEFPSSTDKLAQGLQNAAAVLKTQGNDLAESVALLTAGDVINQDMSKTSAGIRTISLRIAGTEKAKDELASLGEDVDDFIVQTHSKTRDIIKDYTAVASNAYKGVDVLDANGNLKNTYQILLDISRVYSEIQEEDKKAGTNRAQALVEQLAGKNRSNIAASILSNPQLLEDVYNAAQNATGSAQEELDKYLNSVEGKLAKFNNNLQKLQYDILPSDTVSGFIDLGSSAISIIDTLIDKFGGLSSVIGAVVAAFTTFKGVGEPKCKVLIKCADCNKYPYGYVSFLVAA